MSDSESDENYLTSTPQDIKNIAEEATLNLLPDKSRKQYNKIYSNFMEWRTNKRVSSFSENVLLAYFHEISTKYAPSSLWAEYSMIKSTLSIYEKTDISKYSKLHAFLKRKSEGYKPKKAKTFSPDQINTFINKAPNEVYLLTKAAVILGIMGACRRQELQTLLYKNVKDLGNTLLINIINTKTKLDRTFTVTGKCYDVVKKYMDLRPGCCPNERFFIKYYNGKCTSQNIGINTFGNMGKTVATQLKLPNPEQYTGHCFRRTSATFLIDAGGDITALKRHGGWKSTSVAEGYIDNSIDNKIKVSNTILNAIEINNRPSISSATYIPRSSTLATEEPCASHARPSTSNATYIPSSSTQATEDPRASCSRPSTPNATYIPSYSQPSPTFTQNTQPQPTNYTTLGEINLSQILKQNAPVIITNNQFQSLHIHYHK